MATNYLKAYRGRTLQYKSPVTGKETTLYSISTVAEALGRTPQCIRKWEIGGFIPKTPFKLNGMRMYSAEHIDCLVECAEKANLRQGSNTTGARFAKYVWREFPKVNALFFGKEEEK